VRSGFAVKEDDGEDEVKAPNISRFEDGGT